MTTVGADRRVATSSRRAIRGGMLPLVGHQVRYELLMFWRNRQSRFFTLALPVIFLLIFASIWHGDTVAVAGGTIDESVYYVPGIITLGIVSAAFNNLVISVTGSRESGIFKRRRATPVPAAVLIAARALASMVVAFAMTVILLLIGWVAYDATVPAHTAPALVLAVLVGAAAFCCLGYAVASVISNADSAQPLTQAIILPLYFISGVFIPLSTMPGWLTDIASYFPVRHLADALLSAYNPYTTGNGIAWSDLGIVVLWGVIGLLVALRRFSWLPRSHR
jgi:ABC-2 type transport system permease protein